MNAYVTERDSLNWAIARQTDDTLIGMVSLFNLSPQNRRAELGATRRHFWPLEWSMTAHRAHRAPSRSP